MQTLSLRPEIDGAFRERAAWSASVVPTQVRVFVFFLHWQASRRRPYACLTDANLHYQLNCFHGLGSRSWETQELHDT